MHSCRTFLLECLENPYSGYCFSHRCNIRYFIHSNFHFIKLMTISQPIPILSTYLCSRQYDSIRSQTVSFQEGMDDGLWRWVGPQDETLSAQIVITERFCLCPFACKYYSIYWSCIRPCLFRLFFPSLFKFPDKRGSIKKYFIHSIEIYANVIWMMKRFFCV